MIKKSKFTIHQKEHIYKQFNKHAISCMGFNGLIDDPISFEIHENEKLIGICVVQLFWKQLHIKYLVVDEKYRRKGIGRKLMEQALEYGKKTRM